ncbi:protein translocase subunit [Saxophila tyrrhenica]|uniref:Mitochondrial import inner membrane translocase subunit TIM44 n=1 Tax=Saxophila tyrrhenica TaxID=1690608 RepID=A0AAV9P6G7_9PEZI|nr:protein translocase subunit [Saxophila tyrrhenica]
MLEVLLRVAQPGKDRHRRRTLAPPKFFWREIKDPSSHSSATPFSRPRPSNRSFYQYFNRGGLYQSMSAASLRALSQRAGGGLVRSNPSHLPSFSYGRTAAYRRIAAPSRQYSEAALRSRQDATNPRASPHLLPLRSHFLPPSISSSVASELREQRARENAGQAPPRPQQHQQQEQPKAEPEPAAKAEPTAKHQPDPEVADEAEAAFAQAKKQQDKQWAKFQAQQEKEAKEQAEREARGEGEAEGEGEAKEGEQKSKKKDEPAEPPHGGKTPWQVFTETLSSEFKASKEWNDSTKQLSGQINDFTQNPNVQKARSAYSKAADVASTTTGKVVLGSAGAIGKGAAWTWDTTVVRGLRKGATAIGSGVEQATRPLRETEAYKNVKDVVDDGSSQRYGGWTEKEERRRQREAREARSGRRPVEVHEEDPEAGTNVTLHKDSAWHAGWRDFRDNSPVMQRLFSVGATYRESENPLISTARSVSDRIAGFFAENETAMVIKKFREMDPSFQLEPFLTEMRTYILPEVLEAYVKGDVETLKLWLSAAQFQVYSALMHQYTTAGLQSDGKILDIRGVDILSARILEPGEIPVFVLMARTQEVHVYRKKKGGELAAGMEDKVQQVTYAIGVTRVPEEVANPETRGWRLIELQKSGRDYI